LGQRRRGSESLANGGIGIAGFIRRCGENVKTSDSAARIFGESLAATREEKNGAHRVGASLARQQKQ
jgi:hypothetical protein